MSVICVVVEGSKEGLSCWMNSRTSQQLLTASDDTAASFRQGLIAHCINSSCRDMYEREAREQYWNSTVGCDLERGLGVGGAETARSAGQKDPSTCIEQMPTTTHFFSTSGGEA